MDVESLAVSKVNTMIARCSHLKAFITVNDKTPFTDGYIDLYNTIRQSKADWRGRVTVQVKGRTISARKGTPPAHSIPRADLLAYQMDSGVLYFVVTVHGKSSVCTPYYALLSPFRIAALLRGASGDQATVPVPLTRLPSAPKEIESIVALSLKTREQSTSIGFDPMLFDHFASFTVHTASELALDGPVTLAPDVSDFALALNTTDGLSILVGGELRIFPAEYVERKADIRIASGGVVYRGAVVKRVDVESFEVVLSEGLRLVFRTYPGNQSATVHLSLESSLAGRLKSIAFFTALLDTQAIDIDGTSSPFKITQGGDDRSLRSHLGVLRELGELVEALGMDPGLIDLNQIDEMQSAQLGVLHRAFVECKEIRDPSLRASRVIQKMGSWEVMFLITSGSAPDSWRFVDPFSLDSGRTFAWSSDEDDDERIDITSYDLVDVLHLGRVLNMRLDSIVGAYEAIADRPNTSWLANQRVLDLISAADSTEERKDELLGAAAALNDWLLAQDGREVHHLLNHWQILWRRGGLSLEHRTAIRSLKRDILSGKVMHSMGSEVACALLLGDQEEVEELLAGLSNEDRKRLEDWPIWRLRSEVGAMDRKAEKP